MKDDTKWYIIANVIAYIIIYFSSIVIVIKYFDNIVWIVLLLIVLLFVCGFLEEHVISKYINSLVEKILGNK